MMENILVQLSDALATAAERGGESTVLVNARRRIPASGIVYNTDQILTANHVVEHDEDISILLPDGTESPATLIGRDPASDLALLKLEGATATPAEQAKIPARVGQITLALGRPSKEGIEASLGTISAIGRPFHGHHGHGRHGRHGGGGLLDRYLRTDCIPYPGFSGGPLVAADGTVLGLNTSGLARGAAITIPTDIAWKVAESLAKHGHIRQGYLGIRSQTVEIPTAMQNVLKPEQNAETGLLVIGIEDESPAAKDGLMVGDILVGMNGSPIRHHDDLFAQLSGETIGQSMPIDVLRGGQPQTIQVVIGER